MEYKERIETFTILEMTSDTTGFSNSHIMSLKMDRYVIRETTDIDPIYLSTIELVD